MNQRTMETNGLLPDVPRGRGLAVCGRYHPVQPPIPVFADEERERERERELLTGHDVSRGSSMRL